MNNFITRIKGVIKYIPLYMCTKCNKSAAGNSVSMEIDSLLGDLDEQVAYHRSQLRWSTSAVVGWHNGYDTGIRCDKCKPE